MPVLVWDQVGQRRFETGVDRATLFVANGSTYNPGVPWNGVTNISVKPEGAEASPLYADNIQYASLVSAEKIKASIEAFTYPDEFAVCDGTKALVAGVSVAQQPRKQFVLAWRSVIGNDQIPDAGFKIHILYGCQAAPSEKAHATINDSPEAATFSWELTTNAIDVPGFAPTSYVVFDSTKIEASKMKKITDKLWGSETLTSTVILPADIAKLIA